MRARGEGGGCGGGAWVGGGGCGAAGREAARAALSFLAIPMVGGMVPEMPAWYASNFLRVPETKRVGGSVPVMSVCEMSICASTGGAGEGELTWRRRRGGAGEGRFRGKVRLLFEDGVAGEEGVRQRAREVAVPHVKLL